MSKINTRLVWTVILEAQAHLHSAQFYCRHDRKLVRDLERVEEGLKGCMDYLEMRTEDGEDR